MRKHNYLPNYKFSKTELIFNFQFSIFNYFRIFVFPIFCYHEKMA